MTAPARTTLLVSAAALLLACAVALGFGSEPVSLVRALDTSTVDHAIVVSVRLPRVLLAVVAGAGLSLAGCALQALLRNPLAEPYVLGVSGGSAFGATVALLAGASTTTWLGASVVPICALLGGFAATALVWTLARAAGGARTTSVLLAGVVVNAIASALITLAKTLVSPAKAQELLFWLVGFLDVPSWSSLVAVALYVALGSAVLLRDAARLNLLSLGSEAASHLGVRVRALELRVLLACSLVVGAIVSATGLIGFVGLVVPHILRRVQGPDARGAMPASLLLGGATLVSCDLLSRAAFRVLHTEPPVGAVTALLGGPLFLFVLVRGSGRDA